MSEYISYNNTDIVQVGNNSNGIKMLDKLTRIKSNRRIMPLDKEEYIPYYHRGYYNDYCLEIGDSCFMIPPEFIMITSESLSSSLVTLRQENTLKEKHGKHKRSILIDLVFNSLDQINGYKVKGPDKDYYVDGLRQLLAQFKCTPFLPITNTTINNTYGIYTVVLQSITISTINGFPNMIKAQITLQEVNMMPYLEVPDIFFKNMIDWDLFRYYYQSFLTETYEYKKLQSITANNDNIKIKILDPEVFNQSSVNEYNILDVVTDSTILMDGTLSNYKTWLDSSEDDFSLTSFVCNYSNLLTNVQMAKLSSPTVQFLGGMDTIYKITLETTNERVINKIEQCQIENDAMIRNNPKIQASIGFVKIESELVAFTGSLFVMIESVNTNTVPGFPGLYNIEINCIAYDIAQSEKEDISGFWPFKKDDGENPYSTEQSKIHTEQTITQSYDGLITKINQDNYAEYMLRKMEVYPDLHLPTYAEVNAQISKIRKFRENNGLKQIEYTEYPARPAEMLHGTNPDKTVSFSYELLSQNTGIKGLDSGSSTNIIDPTSISREEYEGYVDPDFYVFYPYSNEYLESIEPGFFDKYYQPTTLSSYSKQVSSEPEEIIENTLGNTTGDASLIQKFISLAKSMVGHSYVWGAYGNKSDSKGLVFDCSGLISWCLKTLGITSQRFTTQTIPTSTSVFTQVPNSELMPGDILLKPNTSGSNGHVAIYEGNNQIVHARGTKYGVVEGDISQIKYKSVYRINGLYNNPSSSTSGMYSENSNTNVQENAEYIWNFFKEKGFTEYAIAGILGNIQHESGVLSNNLQNSKEKSLGYNNISYTNAVDNGTYTNFVNDGAGYGIVQFTYSGYKQQLLTKAKANNVSISNLQLQCEILYDQIQGLMPLLNSANTPETAAYIFLMQYEKPANPASSASSRKNYAVNWYSKLSSNTNSSLSSSSKNKKISEDSIKQIACAIDSVSNGCSYITKKYMSQMIYDRINDSRWSTVTNALSTFNVTVTEPTSSTVTLVEQTFTMLVKGDSTVQIYYMLTPDSPVADFERYDNAYDRIITSDQFTFWGSESVKSSTNVFIKSTIDEIKNTITKEVSVNILTCNPDKFAEPLLINTAYYKDNKSKVTEQYREFINSTYYSYHTAFCDMYQYSCRGRLVKAFPTYLLCILDDNSAWYQGNKLWTNFYTHKSTIDIQYHATNDMPIETATIVLNNIYHNLSRTQGGLSQYKLINDDEQFISVFGMYPGKWIYKNFGIKLGFGAKLTSMMIELHQILYNHAKLREGSRIHLRCGYGSDPLSLGPIINGFISDVTLGDQISIVVSSDGNELTLNPVSSKENDTNSGWLGLFGLGENQESSNIIADVMCKRRGFINILVSSWYEQSKYSIEHFGLYLSTSSIKNMDSTAGSYISVSDSINGNINQIDNGASVGTNIADLWNQYQEQYDLLKNVYRANYKGELYIHDNASIFPTDGEQNVVFNKFNMTPWDVCQVCTQQVPEYIFKSSMHQFDSRIYFGLPFWQEKYRYDILNNNTIIEEAKTASQVHYIDSIESIIDNQMTVTSKFTNTNIKVMYTSGKSSTSTSTIHSDDTIDLSKQKTKILDTPISQNILGPDQIIEFLGYKVGYRSARRTGISNLIYGWNQEYQGQIIIIGNPGIKPGDYLLINDTYCDIFGICLVREVTHSFSVNTGFTTSIVPGLIAFSSDQNSGMIESCKSLLDLLGVFSAYSRVRESFYEKYETNLNIISVVDVLEEMTKRQLRLQDQINTYHATATTLSIIRGAISTAQVLKTISTLSQAVQNLKTLIAGIKTIKNIAGIAIGLFTGALNLIPGVGWIVSIAISIILDNIIEYIDNKNVIVLLPLWWEGYPMASLIKDGEHILLIPNNSTATDDTMDSEANNIQYED